MWSQRSSTELDYNPMAHTTCELLWIKHLLEELSFLHEGHMELKCDNQVATHISSKPMFHKRRKHIEVDYHFIRYKM